MRSLYAVALCGLAAAALCFTRPSHRGHETSVAAPPLSLLNSASAAADKGEWGNVKGRIVWGEENLPEVKDLAVTKDQEHCLGKGPIKNEELVVNPKNKGVKWTFVWLADAADPVKAKLPIHPKLAKAPEKDAVLDQPICAFTPHALAMREGQKLVAKNTAPIAHNIHWTGHPLKNPGGNVIVPPQKQHEIEDLKADRFPVKMNCDIHGWMTAWVRVFDHPYFAVTDADGKFEFKDAPAGEYRLVVWHEKGWGEGKREGTKITIKPGDTTDLGDLKYTPPKE